jgi:Xaa-Pro aminopeptidase
MLVVSAERGGLYANVTRVVDFEEPNQELKRRHAACEAILTAVCISSEPT